MYSELRSHIIKLSAAGLRLDGRKLTDFRQPIIIEKGVAKTSEGSARVRIGDTEVVVGVKLEVGSPYPDNPDEGTIIVGAELLPLSNSEFELGPPGIEAIELARVVDRGIRESKTIDFKSLCITPNEKVWLVVIDICTINDAGNLIDASSIGALAALMDTKFPDYDGERIDYKKKTDKGITLRSLPIAITVVKIGNNYMVDSDFEEGKVIDTRLTITSMDDGTLCALQKGGEFPLTTEDISKMVDIAVEKGRELRDLLQ